jgi:hypothetical protein
MLSVPAGDTGAVEDIAVVLQGRLGSRSEVAPRYYETLQEAATDLRSRAAAMTRGWR